MSLNEPFICGQTGGGVTNIHPPIHRNLTISCHKPVSHISCFVVHNYSTLCHIWKHWKHFNNRFWRSSNSKRSNDSWICPYWDSTVTMIQQNLIYYYWKENVPLSVNV